MEEGGFFGRLFGLGEGGEAEEVVELWGGDGWGLLLFGGKGVGEEGFYGPGGIAEECSDVGVAHEWVGRQAAVDLFLGDHPCSLVV